MLRYLTCIGWIGARCREETAGPVLEELAALLSASLRSRIGVKDASLVLLVAGVLVAGTGFQAAHGIETRFADSLVYTRELAQDSGRIIDSILVDNRNIYDTEDEQYSSFIFKLANRLHYRSRESVIRREILLKAGQPFAPALAEETARNLRQGLPLFDAWVETRQLENGHLVVRVVTIDEWSLSAGLSLSRDGSESRYDFSVTERNLLGRNQYLTGEYVVQSDDENYVAAGFRERRLLGAPLQLDLSYSGNPEGSGETIALSHPYYNLLQKHSYGIRVASTGGRREIYSDRRLIGTSQREGDRVETHFSYRFGSYYQKLQVGARLLYRYEAISDRSIVPGISDQERALALAGFPDDSLYYQSSVEVQASNLNFAALQQIDGFGYTEDFILGQSLVLGYSRAFLRDFTDHEFEVFDFGFSQGYRFGSTLAFSTYQRTLWFRHSKDIRRTAWFTASLVNKATDFLTLASRGTYLSDSRASGAEALIVGGQDDLRGFDSFFQTGDRKANFSLESRFHPHVGLLSVLFLPVLFVDGARAWGLGEEFTLDDFYFTAGFGLRLAFERSSKNRMVRFDVSYSQKNGWQVSIGTNQYFRTQQAGFFLTTL